MALGITELGILMEVTNQPRGFCIILQYNVSEIVYMYDAKPFRGAWRGPTHISTERAEYVGGTGTESGHRDGTTLGTMAGGGTTQNG
jgi:hypothetical protein